jgi:hypothetical protein
MTTEGAVVNARTARDSIVTSSLSGFPALSALPGQFLLRDVVLLGAQSGRWVKLSRLDQDDRHVRPELTAAGAQPDHLARRDTVCRHQRQSGVSGVAAARSTSHTARPLEKAEQLGRQLAWPVGTFKDIM